MLKGVLFSVFVGLLAVVLEKFTPPAFNGILIALLLGILLGNTLKLPENLASGIKYTSSKMLELSILFLAVGINYADVAALGVQPFLGVAAVVFTVLFLSFFLAKRFNCPGNTGILVGFGTAICGSSAIAALAPSLQKQNKEDVAIAMAVINLLGTLGMLVLPWALLQVDWPSQDVAASAMGYLVGGSLHSVGNVAGAGFAIGKSAGDIAITVKLARVALLTPGLIFMTYLTQRHSQGSWKRYFQLPWYLIGFILVTLLVSVFDIPKPALKEVEYIGKVILAIAMAVINLLGTLGMLVLPWALLQVDWPSQDVAASAMGYLVGGSLHSVGNVAGAGFAIGKSAGDIAITVKLARVALLTPGLIFMTYLTQRHSQGSWKRYFQLPWYLIGFILVTLLVSVIDIPKPALKEVEYIGKVILTIAMAAIGLKVSVKKLMQAGSRGLRFGVVMFLLQIALLGLVMLVMR